MNRSRSRTRPLAWAPALVIALALIGCEADTMTEPPVQGASGIHLGRAANPASGPTKVAAIVDNVNARLEAAGSEMRLDEVWMFSVGQGTDPFRRLRTGARWVQQTVTYMIDGSDFTADEPLAAVDQAVENGFQTWNGIPQSSLQAVETPDTGNNDDILDGIIRDATTNECVDVVDVTADNLVFFDPVTGAIAWIPSADIVFGGWLDNEYFEDCLGSENILGVTWSFSFGDVNSDNYVDRIYVEMFYNERFDWVTSGATFLGPGEDIETIVLHEVGHAHGLGHFGGPNERQPFKLRGNGTKVFTPEAVMNPFYLGGEKRSPLPTDVAAMRALY